VKISEYNRNRFSFLSTQFEDHYFREK